MGTTSWTINLPYSSTDQSRYSIEKSSESMSRLWSNGRKRLSSSISILRIHRFDHFHDPLKNVSFLFPGKYFCRSCHSEKRFYLPSYIITKWDFSNRHSISNFADEYLHRIFDKPIFNLYDLNPKLYERSTKLRAMNELRWALYSLKFYIIACRFAEEHG